MYQVDAPIFFPLAGLEDELGTVRHQPEELRRRLNDVEDQREALSMAALSVFRVVRAEEPLLTDRLRALPGRIRAAVSLGARRGTVIGLHLEEFEPGFPQTASATTRRALMFDFSRFAAVAATEVDVDDILQRGADPSQDRVWKVFSVVVVMLAYRSVCI